MSNTHTCSITRSEIIITINLDKNSLAFCSRICYTHYATTFFRDFCFFSRKLLYYIFLLLHLFCNFKKYVAKGERKCHIMNMRIYQTIIQQLCEIIDIVRDKHLRLVIVGSITLDCRNGKCDPMSEAFLQMAGVFSQLELAMIRARAKGVLIGRPQVTKEDILAIF